MIRDALGLILTGENDLRLKDLTQSRSVAALPMWGRYRMIDFLLSNMVNSGVRNIGLITQKNYHSLMDHLGSGKEWDLNRKRDGLLILPPFVTKDNVGVYKGTVDAIKSVMGYLRRSTQKYVIFSNSHTVFKIDFTEAMQAHIDTGADITVLYHEPGEMDRRDCMETAYIDTAEDGRVVGMEYAPAHPKSNKAMLDVWIMEKSLLQYLVEEAVVYGNYAFVQGVLMPKLQELHIYGFEHEGYVACIDSVQSYYRHNMALLDPVLREEFFYENGRIYTKIKDEVPAYYSHGCNVKNSMVADGCVVEGTVENSILFRGVRVGKNAVVKNSVVMQGTEIQDGAQIEHVILDKGCFVKRDVRMIGQPSYPIVIAKNAVV